MIKNLLVILTILTVGCSREIPNKDMVVYSHTVMSGYSADLITVYSEGDEVEDFSRLSKDANRVCDKFKAKALVLSGKGGITESGNHTYTLAFACY